jgi:16S rRNA (guanine(966)-N(2))-methyltransferase RsmD
MRIIRGSHRGRKIIAPSGLPVRPTTDLAKESLFNILENHFSFEEISVLDLFAGTGNISYEFASRESPLVVAVEVNPRCARFIEETANRLGFLNLRLVRGTAESFLKRSSQKFDIIFADPPYELDSKEEIVQLVFGNELLTPEGWLVVEHSRADEFGSFPQFFDLRKYGKVHFSFFRYKNE